MTRRHVSGAQRHNHPGMHHAAPNGSARDAISPSGLSAAAAAQVQRPNQQDTEDGRHMDRQLTRVQLERWLGIGRSTIYRRMRAGKFPSSATYRGARRTLVGKRDRALAGIAPAFDRRQYSDETTTQTAHRRAPAHRWAAVFPTLRTGNDHLVIWLHESNARSTEVENT